MWLFVLLFLFCLGVLFVLCLFVGVVYIWGGGVCLVLNNRNRKNHINVDIQQYIHSVAKWLSWRAGNCGRIGAIGSSPSVCLFVLFLWVFLSMYI